uniref:TORC_N domain-containing protein n=1 Tax=Angiostrongylus cantonensis TaxID=6313 RepID=A0A0K0DPT9_ANGCA
MVVRRSVPSIRPSVRPSVRRSVMTAMMAMAAAEGRGLEGLGDPLGEFSNLSSFNLLEFVHNDNTPLDSPDPSRNGNHSNNDRNAQGLGNNSQHNSHTMFQNATRLPESPPITDISGAGSSGSPESNSDAPYSPENYPNYVGLVQCGAQLCCKHSEPIEVLHITDMLITLFIVSVNE